MSSLLHRLLLLFILTPLSLARAGDPAESLRTINHFAFGGTGIAGTTSAGEHVFREVMKSKDPRTAFLQAVEKGTPAAMCYGLAGLKAVDPVAFNEKAAALEKRQEVVETMAGCMVMKEPVSAVVAQIRKGNYDVFLKNPPPERNLPKTKPSRP